MYKVKKNFCNKIPKRPSSFSSLFSDALKEISRLINDVSNAYHGIWSKEQDSIGQPRGRLIEDLYGILI